MEDTSHDSSWISDCSCQQRKTFWKGSFCPTRVSIDEKREQELDAIFYGGLDTEEGLVAQSSGCDGDRHE